MANFKNSFLLKKENGEVVDAICMHEFIKKSGIVPLSYFNNPDINMEEDENWFKIIDSWESQEAIDKHHATPMMDKITELRNKYDLHMKVERYIEDTAGIPDKDKNFIKE